MHTRPAFAKLLKTNFVLRTLSLTGAAALNTELERRHRMPHVRFLIRTRALCLAGRCCAAGGRSAIAAWLCERAPLWMLVRVVEMM